MEIKKYFRTKKIWTPFLIFNIKIHVFFKKSSPCLLRNRGTTDWARGGRTARPLSKPALGVFTTIILTNKR